MALNFWSFFFYFTDLFLVARIRAMFLAQSSEDGTMPILAAAFDESTKNGDFWGPENRLKGKYFDVRFHSQMFSMFLLLNH